VRSDRGLEKEKSGEMGETEVRGSEFHGECGLERTVRSFEKKKKRVSSERSAKK
jgi:hypothetical protein